MEDPDSILLDIKVRERVIIDRKVDGELWSDSSNAINNKIAYKNADRCIELSRPKFSLYYGLASISADVILQISIQYIEIVFIQ